VSSDVQDRVISTLKDVFDNKGLTPPPLDGDTPLDQSLGLESLDFAELVVRLESEFGKDPFSTGTPPRVRTLGELATYYE
jgi:acyl carrier protein